MDALKLSIVVGIISGLIFSLAVPVFLYDDLTGSLTDGYGSASRKMTGLVEEAISEDKMEDEAVVHLVEGTVLTSDALAAGVDSVEGYQPYYVKEHKTKPYESVNVSFECEGGCSTSGEELTVEEDGDYLAVMECEERGEELFCEISLSPTDREPEPALTGGLVQLKEGENPVEKEMIESLERDIEESTERIKEADRKEVWEKPFAFYSGEGIELVSDLTVLGSRTAAVGDVIGLEKNYFYNTQQEHDLFYPDGSKDPEVFVSNTKDRLKEVELEYTSEKSLEKRCSDWKGGDRVESGGMSSDSIVKSGSSIEVPTGTVSRGKEESIVKSGFGKLGYHAVIGGCVLLQKLSLVGKGISPETVELSDYPDYEPVSGSVYRSLLLRDLVLKCRDPEESDDLEYAVINHVIWLNETNSSSAAEEILFCENSSIDLSLIERKTEGKHDFSGELIDSYRIKKEDDELKVESSFPAVANTTRNCEKDPCTYVTYLERTW